MRGPDCARFEPWIEDAIDGRLESADAEVLAAHLATCDPCRALDEQLRWVRASLRDALSPERDSSLEARLRAAIAADASEERSGESVSGARVLQLTRRRLLVGALAAGAAGLIWWRRQAPADTLDVLSAELRAFERNAPPPGYAALSPDALQAHFAAAGLGFPARVIDLSAMGVRVLGGGTLPLAGRPATLVLYEHHVGLMVCRMALDANAPGLVPARPPALRERGFAFVAETYDDASFVFWREGPVTCVLVARLPVEELLALAREKAMAATP